MRKKPTRKRPYFMMESAMTAILRDASGKMHRHATFLPNSCVADYRQSVSSYKQSLRLCMRNKTQRSANAKYHYSFLFFYKMNKGHLLLMYSCVFWCENIDLVFFFFLAFTVWPCHFLHNSGAPWVRKWSNLPIRENLKITWPYTDQPPAGTERPSVRTTGIPM